MLIDPTTPWGRFQSSRKRIERAEEHRGTLDAEIQAFIRREPNAIPVKIDPYIRDQPLPDWARKQLEDSYARINRLRVTRPVWEIGREIRPNMKVGDEAPLWFSLNDDDFLIRWGVLLGDLVHALRSALDNLVWASTVALQATLGNSPPPRPFPPKSPWNNVAFPIRTDPAHWPKAVTTNLWGVDPVLQAFIEEVQPYKSGKPTPQDAALYVLRELSNIDKHMGVNFLATKAQVQALQMPTGMIFTPKAAWELKSHAEVGRVRFLTQDAVDSYLKEVNVNLNVTFEIALGKGTPAQGRPIWEVVSAMLGAVDQFVRLADARIVPATGRFRPI